MINTTRASNTTRALDRILTSKEFALDTILFALATDNLIRVSTLPLIGASEITIRELLFNHLMTSTDIVGLLEDKYFNIYLIDRVTNNIVDRLKSNDLETPFLTASVNAMIWDKKLKGFKLLSGNDYDKCILRGESEGISRYDGTITIHDTREDTIADVLGTNKGAI